MLNFSPRLRCSELSFLGQSRGNLLSKKWIIASEALLHALTVFLVVTIVKLLRANDLLQLPKVSTILTAVMLELVDSIFAMYSKQNHL